ncbi:MAG: hypothetical protein ACYDAD_05975 [Acidimicrobiales bacterium]
MTPGRRILQWTWAGTILFTASATAAVLAPAVFGPLDLAVSVVLFGSGCVLFAWSYGLAVVRSRQDELAVSSLYFLTGSVAPSAVRRQLLGALGVQAAVAVASAAARPYTSLAAGTLVPVYGLGLCGLWGARHGRFPRRDQSRMDQNARRWR